MECELQATVVSLDGRCEYDCISRDASFRKVHEVAPTLVPHHPHRPFLYPGDEQEAQVDSTLVLSCVLEQSEPTTRFEAAFESSQVT